MTWWCTVFAAGFCPVMLVSIQQRGQDTAAALCFRGVAVVATHAVDETLTHHLSCLRYSWRTGAIVAIQWPNPRILCYKTSYSDLPSSSGRSCCSLYSLNLGFCVFWLLVFAIMVIARDLLRIIVCLSFALGHILIIVSFRMKFKRYGRPERPHNSAAMVSPLKRNLTAD